MSPIGQPYPPAASGGTPPLGNAFSGATSDSALGQALAAWSGSGPGASLQRTPVASRAFAPGGTVRVVATRFRATGLAVANTSPSLLYVSTGATCAPGGGGATFEVPPWGTLLARVAPTSSVTLASAAWANPTPTPIVGPCTVWLGAGAPAAQLPMLTTTRGTNPGLPYSVRSTDWTIPATGASADITFEKLFLKAGLGPKTVTALHSLTTVVPAAPVATAPTGLVVVTFPGLGPTRSVTAVQTPTAGVVDLRGALATTATRGAIGTAPASTTYSSVLLLQLLNTCHYVDPTSNVFDS